jgi:hypothetical protein
MTNAVCCQTPGRHEVDTAGNEDSVKDVVFGAVNSCLVGMACCIYTKSEAAYLCKKLHNNMCNNVLSHESRSSTEWE